MKINHMLYMAAASFIAVSNPLSCNPNISKNQHSNEHTRPEMNQHAPVGDPGDGYCCCNQSGSQCLNGDSQTCCTHSEHPIPQAAWGTCWGVHREGDLCNDPNPCGNSCHTGLKK